MSDNIEGFCKELAALMRKHKIVCIGGQFDGDTHGIHDERFVIIDSDNKTHSIIHYSTVCYPSNLMEEPYEADEIP